VATLCIPRRSRAIVTIAASGSEALIQRAPGALSRNRRRQGMWSCDLHVFFGERIGSDSASNACSRRPDRDTRVIQPDRDHVNTPEFENITAGQLDVISAAPPSPEIGDVRQRAANTSIRAILEITSSSCSSSSSMFHQHSEIVSLRLLSPSFVRLESHTGQPSPGHFGHGPYRGSGTCACQEERTPFYSASCVASYSGLLPWSTITHP
jgi:hypothetical protein